LPAGRTGVNSTMPSSQSEYPLTLAEVLFDELETTCADLDESEIEIDIVIDAEENRGRAVMRAITKEIDWDEVEKKIDLIKTLPAFSKKQIEEICEEEGIEIDEDDKGDQNAVVWKCKKELSLRLVPIIYEIMRNLPRKRSALCLSGGGVRSAVFNLGILQGLARCGLLDQFDYLSTVSGGGFIGSWLTAWIYREKGDIKRVVRQLADQPENPLEPEAKPLYNLRIYANYLTPKKGLLSVDTWTLVAIYLRNLLLNWMVFVPVIMAFLILPRIWVAYVKSSYLDSTTLLAIGFLTAAFALGYIATNLPGAKLWSFHESRFVYFCLAPLVISAMALTTYWFRLGTATRPAWWQFIMFALLLGVLPWFVSLLIRLIKGNWQGSFGGYVGATVLILIAFALAGILIWYITNSLNWPKYFNGVYFARIYASLAVPSFLILLTVGGTFIAGFTSRFTDVDDQEWWARSGAWILIVVVGWTVFHLLVLFGPVLLVGVQHNLVNLVLKRSWAGSDIKGIVTTLVGIVSGAITLFGGTSAKTPAHGERDKPADWKAKVLSVATSMAAVIFAAFIAIVFALFTNLILSSALGETAATFLRARSGSIAADPQHVIYESPGRVLVAFMLAIAIVGWVLGLFINTNRFSLHYYWRNRMMRAYLGVSRDQEERKETSNGFTDFDLKDNVQMYELRQQKPLHVVNVTLNLAGGDKLEWQDRKAESFTISPLHSGSYWLGYRDSARYGGANGISLATSVAISGAAASPNMGYMMTSPVVRFIMTLFNVRLGFWLGNPRKPTFDQDSPTYSVGPIFSEALGLTNDQSPYVYLSDGGHFDNFGLYEMILRRCRFIVVSDASTDPTYCYESLAYAIRQIRVDFGVPIEFRDKLQLGKNLGEPNRYCAIADIHYSCVDKPHGPSPNPDYDGVLIYIKPSLTGKEQADVLNFHESDDAFPQDTIVDQWFGEAQFESYRMLGSHMIKTICPKPIGDRAGSFDKFEDLAKKHLGLK
jgi:hypothetical protein